MARKDLPQRRDCSKYRFSHSVAGALCKLGDMPGRASNLGRIVQLGDGNSPHAGPGPTGRIGFNFGPARYMDRTGCED